MAFKTTSTKAAGTGVFYLSHNSKSLYFDEPYVFPSYTQGDSVPLRFCFVGNDKKYIENPVSWNANTEFRLSGVTMMYE